MTRGPTTTEDLATVCRVRRVESPCPACRGLGVACDDWRGGMRVGRPWDVCSRCWGTGDADRTGDDLLAMRAELAAAGAASGLAWLAQRTTGGLASLRNALTAVAEILDRQAERRSVLARDGTVLRALANACREMATEGRR